MMEKRNLSSNGVGLHQSWRGRRGHKAGLRAMNGSQPTDIPIPRALDDMRNEILQQIEDGITSGTLVKAGTRSIELMLAAPAISLAKRASLMGVVPDEDQLNEVFSLVWASISSR